MPLGLSFQTSKVSKVATYALSYILISTYVETKYRVKPWVVFLFRKVSFIMAHFPKAKTIDENKNGV
jgi:hypothetical protein